MQGGAITERTAHDWNIKFKKWNFDLKDVLHSVRPVEFDEERLNKFSNENSLKMAEKIKYSHAAIEN